MPHRGRRAVLRATLANQETVALVSPTGSSTGSGTSVELLRGAGAPAAGPAVLALETGAPAWVVATAARRRPTTAPRIDRLDAAR